MLQVGLNPYGLTYYLGLQGHGTPRANPDGRGLDGFIEIAREIGARTIELHNPWLTAMSDEELAALRRRLATLGLVPIIASGLMHEPEGAALRPAVALGAKTIRLVLTRLLCGDRNALGAEWPLLVARVRDGLHRYAAQAAAAGVTLAIEDHQDFNSQELVELCDEAGANVGICFDIANAFSVGEAPIDFTRRAAAKVRHIHLKDYNVQFTDEGYRLVRCAIGDGAVPFREVIAILAEHHRHADRHARARRARGAAHPPAHAGMVERLPAEQRRRPRRVLRGCPPSAARRGCRLPDAVGARRGRCARRIRARSAPPERSEHESHRNNVKEGGRMSKELSGTTAFVTGSGRGLGRVMAERLAELGADVAIHDIDWTAPAKYGEAPDLGAVAKEMEKYGTRTVAVTGNIGDPAAVAKMKTDINGKLGAVNVLVNCAGGDIGAKGGKPDPNDALHISFEDIKVLTNNNLIGTMLVCQAFVPPMVEAGTGSVINIASAAAHLGCSPEAVYSTLKAAVVHWTRCLAKELLTKGVRINAVSPGPTKSARFKATRVLDPEKMDSSGRSFVRYAEPAEIADAVAFLAGPRSRFINGQVLRVDGGITLFPG